MKQNYPLHRQSIECYLAIKLLLTHKNFPSRLAIKIPIKNNEYIISILDSLILAQKSNINQILPTNTISVATTSLNSQIEISNQDLLEFDSTHSLVEHIAKKVHEPNTNKVINSLSLIYGINDNSIKHLELNLKKYLTKIVDNRLHATNSCTYEYQIEKIRNTISTLSSHLNINHLELNNDIVFVGCSCRTYFIEIMCTLFVSGTINIHHVSLTNSDVSMVVGVNDPDDIDVNSIRAFFNLNPIQYVKPHFHGEQTHTYHNGVLYLKTGNNETDSIDFGKSISARYLFETMYELARISPLGKTVFTRPEISKMYAELHRGTPHTQYKIIDPGYISKVVDNCKAVMFKGKNSVYRERFNWTFSEEKGGYIFEIK